MFNSPYNATSFHRRLLAGFLLLPLLVTVFNIVPAKTHAISSSAFNPGHIIDDAVFTNNNSMSVQDIQNFLNAKAPNCDTNGTQASSHANGSGGYYTRAQWGAMNGNPAPFTCLKNYVENPTTKQNNIGTPTSQISGGESAAQIIWNAAQSYHINPQVIITTLQKEQGLVTDDWPWAYEYKSAMGYGCPDTAACDSKYYGFFNQVDNAAWQFRHYLDNPGSYNYSVGSNYILFNPNTSCGGSVVNIQNMATAALYIYTPYQPNVAALNAGYGSAPPCGAYGNRNFWLYFNDWFGSTLMPFAFKTASSATVYIYVSGYKLAVPSMGLLQDYGISPGSIQTVDQSTFDAAPTPDQASGISTQLGYLTKSPSDTDSDGGTVYLISLGRKYPIGNMARFTDFGLNSTPMTYLPLGYISNLSTGQNLSNFIQTPDGSILKVASGLKSLIFDFQTYNSLNPGGYFTPLSGFTANNIPTGSPVPSYPVFLKSTNNSSVYFYTNGSYYGFPSLDVFSCWGVSSEGTRPLRSISPDYLPATVTTSGITSCLEHDSQGLPYILNGGNKLSIPASYGITVPSTPSDISSYVNTIPTGSSPLKQAIKSSTSSTVWYLQSGTRRPVPSMSDFSLLGLGSQLDIISNGAVNAIPPSSLLKLGTGQTVKTTDSSTVYVINGDQRIAIASANDFNAFHYKWNNIESYSTTQIDAAYPVSNNVMQSYFFDQASNMTYLLDPNGCYSLDSTMLNNYGQTQDAIVAAQSYQSTIFPYLSLKSCPVATSYVKAAGQSTVYLLSNGQKQAFTSWSKLQSQSHQTSPNITTLTSAKIDAFPSGPNI